jgi:hypothetical protein
MDAAVRQAILALTTGALVTSRRFVPGGLSVILGERPR